MCGIVGFTGPKDYETLRAMAHLLKHRGPDDFGYKESNSISLAMRRLSIVDIAGGQQPVENEDDSISVIFNGEIYNHRALRAELEAKRHQFRSHHSDSEILPHLYEEEGPEFLNKLNGMFAIALWDNKKQELHLARDRCGIKPLYFSVSQGQIVFASEIKSILRHPLIKKEPNFSALYHYFSFKNIPAPLSAFKNIEQLKPGEHIVFRTGDLIKRKWWKLNFTVQSQVTEAEAAKKIRYLLEDSVRIQIESDVPYGAYLSGGLDSSSIVALMSQVSGKKITTFTLAYEDEFQHKTADRHFAKIMSDQYGADHHEYVMRASEFPEAFDSILSAFDEPFSGVTSTYFITRLISQHVKVALSGDGADELFGSYLPHRLAQPLALLADGQDEKQIEAFGINRDYLEKICNRDDEASRRMDQYVWDEFEKKELLNERFRNLALGSSTEEWIRHLYSNIKTRDPLNRALAIDFDTLLPDQVLAFVDRLSMAHSVEVRPPYLDHRLVEFVATLPGSMKIKGTRVKHILKEAVSDLLPAELVDRPKEGFVLPVNIWLNTELRGYVEGILSEDRLKIHDLFSTEFIKRTLAEHFSGKRNRANCLWNLVAFQLWWEQHFA